MCFILFLLLPETMKMFGSSVLDGHSPEFIYKVFDRWACQVIICLIGRRTSNKFKTYIYITKSIILR